MDVRICFRVRERKDVELVLGQGMLAGGWHAHTLNAPGKFLISAPEHDTPRRARAYLLTDQAVTATARAHAGLRPPLDEVSQRAMDERAQMSPDEPAQMPAPDHRGGNGRGPGDARDAPEAILWAALSLAPEGGISVPALMSATGMGRRWVYYRLRDLADNGRAIQTERGNWRAADLGGDIQ
jgi:S-DNA-T family DNA segregation ATPase FtsK/SpoIIIE